jgi:hypothetical protein
MSRTEEQQAKLAQSFNHIHIELDHSIPNRNTDTRWKAISDFTHLSRSITGGPRAMYDKDRIIFQIERTRVLSLQMIDRIPHDRWLEMPRGITHVAWNVGHIAIAEYFLGLVLIRGMKESDQDFMPNRFPELFGYGSVASDEPSRYPSPTEILNVLNSVHDHVLSETKAIPEHELAEPCKFLEGEFDHHPIFEDRGGALEWLTFHEHIHIGTIGLLRRELGGEPIQYLQESREGKRFI